MSEPAAFARVVASLYDAMLDETLWPATSALIDEACGVVGNALLVGEGPPDDIRVLFVGLYYRGQRRLDLEREYLDIYHPINEAIPRQLQLPAGQLVPIPDLYTAAGVAGGSSTLVRHSALGRRTPDVVYFDATSFGTAA